MLKTEKKTNLQKSHFKRVVHNQKELSFTLTRNDLDTSVEIFVNNTFTVASCY